jgi:transcriptional regulator with XRE-family HTH domain
MPKNQRNLVHLKKFGSFISDLRVHAKQTQQSASDAMKNYDCDFSRENLAKLEYGLLADPKPEVLRVIATVYNVRYDVLLVKLIEDKYHVSLRLN